MNSKKRARLQALVTLANDGGAAEGEANNAARAVCKMLSEVGLSCLESPPTPSEDMQRMVTVLRRANVDLEVKVRTLEAELDKARKASTVAGAGVGAGAMSSWVPLVNKYPATCRGCGRGIPEGVRVMWQRGKGVAHERCVSEVS